MQKNFRQDMINSQVRDDGSQLDIGTESVSKTFFQQTNVPFLKGLKIIPIQSFNPTVNNRSDLWYVTMNVPILRTFFNTEFQGPSAPV